MISIGHPLKVLALAAMASGACACAGHSVGREVAAVVHDEDARQAATAAAPRGEDSKAALEAGAAAAERSRDVSEPPT